MSCEMWHMDKKWTDQQMDKAKIYIRMKAKKIFVENSTLCTDTKTPMNKMSLYKFGSCLFVCPSVYLSVCHIFLHINSSANWCPNFTKPSAYL